MAKTKSSSNRLKKLLPLLIAGLCIGWLAGLSLSPVISIIMTGVTGSITALVAVLSGIETDHGSNSSERIVRFPSQLENLSVVPIAGLLVAIVFGSAIGIYARNNHLLGSDIKSELKKLTDLGIDEKDAIKMVTSSYAIGTTKTAPVNTGGTGLWNQISQSECAGFREAIKVANSNSDSKYQDLRDLLAKSTDAIAARLSTEVVNGKFLAQIVEEKLCSP